MKGLMRSVVVGTCLLTSAGMAFAKTTPTPVTGQPGVNGGTECGEGTATSIPGGSAPGSSSGSPFTGGIAGSVYANTFGGAGGTPLLHGAPATATSQYDVACAKAQLR
jgi:hypothetical protein